MDHKFSEPGHTYLNSDRDFGKVEILVKRQENIYTVDKYQDVMTNSQSKATVTRIGDKIIDIIKLGKSLGLTKQTLNIGSEKIEFRDKVRWLRTEFGKYQYKHSFSDQELWKYV